MRTSTVAITLFDGTLNPKLLASKDFEGELDSVGSDEAKLLSSERMLFGLFQIADPPPNVPLAADWGDRQTVHTQRFEDDELLEELVTEELLEDMPDLNFVVLDCHF